MADKTYIIETSDKFSEELHERIDVYKELMLNINQGQITGLFYEKPMSWPYFKVADEIQSRSGLTADIHRIEHNPIKAQIKHFISWYPIIA